MNILVTGSQGFIGKNLIARIEALKIGSIMSFDINDSNEKLEEYIKKSDFIFHLAGINRPENISEFYSGNSELTEIIVKIMIANKIKVPIVFTSTAQVGNGSDYAKSKEIAEKTLLNFQECYNNDIFIYRLPGVFGKWSRPNYNTVVATFCNNIANNLPIEIRDPDFELTLIYIDDVINIFIKTLNEIKFQNIEPLYTVTLGKLASVIKSFASEDNKLVISDLSDSFIKKIYAVFLSYLPEEKISYPLLTHTDERGSFTEFLHLPKHGQVSVNISKPGIEKGNHWHDTKHEKFLVVHGNGVIKLRMLNSANVLEYPVNGNELKVIDIPPGYTHSIVNNGDTDMVTIIWVSEIYDPSNPDTFYEKV